MISSAKSARLLEQYRELFSKDSFDLSFLKKGLLPDREFSRSTWYFSLSCWRPNMVLKPV